MELYYINKEEKKNKNKKNPYEINTIFLLFISLNYYYYYKSIKKKKKKIKKKKKNNF